MPGEQEAFQKAVSEVLKVVIFENWLRFYFISEEDGGALKIELPEKSIQKISELYPDFAPLAQTLNGKPIDLETSRAAVLTYVLNNLDGKKLKKGDAQSILSSSTFQNGLLLFNTWVQAHENQLDQHFLDFGTWLKLFEEWRSGPGGKELQEKLANREA